MDKNLSKIYRFSDFIRNPSTDIYDNSVSGSEKFIEIIKLVGLCFLTNYLITFFEVLLLNDTGGDVIDNQISNSTTSLFRLYLLSVVLIPPLEEIEYRLSLRFNEFYLSLSTCLITSTILFSFIYATLRLFDSFYMSFLFYFILIVLIVTFFLYPIYTLISKKSNYIAYFYNNKYQFIFWGFSLYFGFMHLIPNIIVTELTPSMNYIFELLKYTTIAVIIGYARLRYGFLWGICLHSFFNLIGISLSLLIT